MGFPFQLSFDYLFLTNQSNIFASELSRRSLVMGRFDSFVKMFYCQSCIRLETLQDPKCSLSRRCLIY